MNVITDENILAVLRIHAPIKARRIADMISKDFEPVSRAEVNSMLYRMKSQGIVRQNGDYEWSINKNGSSQRAQADPSKAESQTRQTFTYTDEQRRIIDLDATGDLLIRGQVGSGKTTVLAARAGRILAAMGKGSILFITYNSALCNYVQKMFSNSHLKRDVRVMTYHNWAKTTASKLGYDFAKWIDGQTRAQTLREIISRISKRAPGHRLFSVDKQEVLDWWSDEIAWIFGQGISSLSEYEKVERTGRGTAVRLFVDERELVWKVFEEYREWLDSNNYEDYDNPGGVVEKGLHLAGGDLPDRLRFDHVFVDEVQDFDKSWLVELARVPRVSLSLAGDLAQKIYKRNFTWKSVGIDISAQRSRKLLKPFRATKPIMEVAVCLATNEDVEKDDDYVRPTVEGRDGPKVCRISRAEVRTAYAAGYDYIAESFKRIRKSSVAVALPFSRQVFGAEKALAGRGVKATSAKGRTLGRADGGVVITTFHQLKGLEFDHVVLMGLDDKNFPGRFLERVPEDDHAQEEAVCRRLAYVAMTRAKKTLTVVGGQPFCRFFSDIPDDLFQER